MKEVALHEAKDQLSALVAEVEATGEEIVITRHGKPAARIVRVLRRRTARGTRETLKALLSSSRERAAARPGSNERTTWEQLKGWMDEDR